MGVGVGNVSVCDAITRGRTVDVAGLNESITVVNLLPSLCKMAEYSIDNQSHTDQEFQFYNQCCGARVGEGEGGEGVAILPVYLLLLLLAPIGITANSLIMVTVYKVKRLRNTTGFFICNLAFADILLILEMILYFVYQQSTSQAVHLNQSRFQEYIFPSFDVFLGSASLLLVTAVSIERGVAVARPLKYPRYLSERRAKIIIIVIWAYCGFFFFLGVLRIWIRSDVYAKMFFFTAATLSFFIPCIFVVTSYNIIVFSALKTMKMEKKICKALVAIAAMNQNREQNGGGGGPNAGPPVPPPPAQTVKNNRCREIKVALKVTTLTCPFVVGWGYFMVCNVYEMAADYEFRGVSNFMILFIPFIVSCLNPLTYIMFTRTLRQGAWLILSRSHAGSKLYRLICLKKEERGGEGPVVRQRLRPQDRVRQMQYGPEQAKYLEKKNMLNTSI